MDLTELLSEISCSEMDFFGKEGLRINSSMSKDMPRIHDRYSTLVFTQVLVPLLGDQDKRVRNAAAKALVKLIPTLYGEGDAVLRSCLDSCGSGRLSCSESLVRTLVVCHKGVEYLLPPFDRLLSRRLKVKHSKNSSIEDLIYEQNASNLSKVIDFLTKTLLTCNERFLRVRKRNFLVTL